jgi:hypothetical protein
MMQRKGKRKVKKMLEQHRNWTITRKQGKEKYEMLWLVGFCRKHSGMMYSYGIRKQKMFENCKTPR